MQRAILRISSFYICMRQAFMLSHPKAMRKSILCSLLFIYTLFAQAQKPDSTFYVSATRDQYLFEQNKSSKAIDTTLDNHHNYYQTGVLGNMGLPSYSLLAAAPERASSTFFNWNKLNNRNDLITENDPLYFHTEKIYTKIDAAMGQKQEQFLKLVHSQNIKKKVNVSFLFNRYSCTGFYQQQQSLTTNLLLSSNYKADNGKWGYGTYLLFNKLKYALNGGITKADSFLTNYPFVDKSLFPTNFTSATAKQNIRTTSMSFQTFYRLNASDSAQTNHYLVYETNYQSNYFLYTDGLGDTLPQSKQHLYSYAGQGSHDSTGNRIFSNSLLYKLNTFENKFIFYAGYRMEAIKYHQNFIDTVGTNHILKSGFNLHLNHHLLSSTGEYVLSGLNKNNYEWNANYQYQVTNNLFIHASAQMQSRLPDFNLMAYNGNRFDWFHLFSAVQTQDASFSIVENKYKFKAGAFLLQQQNQIYFNTLALPTQFQGSTQITRFFIGKDLRLAHIHLNNTVHYQTTSNTNIIRLPNWVTSHQLYYEGKLFKNNLWLQVGFQARYISSYMANAYMPATNQFYLQNDKSYGNYIFIDFFISAEIKPVKFFIMAQHINQGFMSTNYILTPGYPMPDRSIKLGLSWLLFD